MTMSMCILPIFYIFCTSRKKIKKEIKKKAGIRGIYDL